jgi:hypothetical protein
MDDGRWFVLGAVAMVAAMGAVASSRRGSSDGGGGWVYEIAGDAIVEFPCTRLYREYEVSVPDEFEKDLDARDAAEDKFIHIMKGEDLSDHVRLHPSKPHVEDVEIDSIRLIRRPRRSFRSVLRTRQEG